jgi:hypothetical protein
MSLHTTLRDANRSRQEPASRRHDDLDALAGSWRKRDAAEFERATAPFGEVDAKLWR